MAVRLRCRLSLCLRFSLQSGTNVRYFINKKNFSNASETTNLFYHDPCEDLRQYLTVPLFGENDKPFQPSCEEITTALQMFKPRRNHDISFVNSFLEFDKLPQQNIPERDWNKSVPVDAVKFEREWKKVVFIGRSNVGKSSLLQAMVKDVPNLRVRTSKKPGFTKTLNFFAIGRLLFLVDAPGYGFNQPKHFVQTVETYLRQRNNLVRTFLLVDGKVGFTDVDYVALEMIEEFGIPYALVLTKVDKATASRRLVNLTDVMRIREKFSSPSCFIQPFMVSAVTGEGMGHFMAFVAYVTGNLSEK